ncbi:MAG: hypothetical protein EZS28_004618 [Streblomastix strix]|uniref:Uncharacterized protein n=1 Tax=Streblomastix strix TaxID=222440 RepID=A0A5J4WY94_9EUKA|nr:MAG: hypothetical protein EZS28_004618 [Streblomastix strix]
MSSEESFDIEEQTDDDTASYPSQADSSLMDIIRGNSKQQAGQVSFVFNSAQKKNEGTDKRLQNSGTFALSATNTQSQKKQIDNPINPSSINVDKNDNLEDDEEESEFMREIKEKMLKRKLARQNIGQIQGDEQKSKNLSYEKEESREISTRRLNESLSGLTTKSKTKNNDHNQCIDDPSELEESTNTQTALFLKQHKFTHPPSPYLSTPEQQIQNTIHSQHKQQQQQQQVYSPSLQFYPK